MVGILRDRTSPLTRKTLKWMDEVKERKDVLKERLPVMCTFSYTSDYESAGGEGQRALGDNLTLQSNEARAGNMYQKPTCRPQKIWSLLKFIEWDQWLQSYLLRLTHILAEEDFSQKKKKISERP